MAKERTSSHSGVFGSVQDSWNRIATGSGSLSDLRRVIAALGKEWAIPSSDPRGFEQWLGVPRTEQVIPLLAQRRQDFEEYQRQKLEETRGLVRGVVSGPHTFEFFKSLRALSEELKEVCYRAAIAAASPEALVLVLTQLSLERPALASECLVGLPQSVTFTVFLSYVEGGRRLLLDEAQSRAVANSEARDHLGGLLRIAVLPVERQRAAIAELDQAELSGLVGVARTLMEIPLEEGFGKFLRFHASTFICLSGSGGELVDAAKAILRASGQREAADVFAALGTEELFDSFKGLRSSRRRADAPFIAGLIDAIRDRAPEALMQFIGEIMHHTDAADIALALSARSALMRMGGVKESQFNRFLLKGLKSDKSGVVLRWLHSNADFFGALRLDRMPSALWKAALNAYLVEKPQAALQLLKRTLEDTSVLERRGYWQEGMQGLLRVGTVDAERFFVASVVRELQEGDREKVRDLLAKEPARSFVGHRLWALMKATTPEHWTELLNAAVAGMSPSEVVALLEQGAGSGTHIRDWLAHVIPSLLANRVLSPDFGQLSQDRSFLTAAAMQVSRRISEDLGYLRQVPDEWAAKRARLKEEIGAQIGVALRVALQNCGGNTVLHSQMLKLSSAVDEWKRSDSPRVDPALESVCALKQPPARNVDARVAAEVFQTPSSNLHRSALFVAGNPWVIDLIFGDSRGPWPRPEVLLAHLCKSSVFFADLRRRAEAAFGEMDQVMRVELAVTIRDYVADIEADLAGYFAFRSILTEVGLQPVESSLGGEVRQNQLSSDTHKVIRDRNREGRLRVFSMGLKVGDRVIGSSRVMKSGDTDDRD